MSWRPIKSLRVSDFESCPVWEHKLEGESEIVRPAKEIKKIVEAKADALGVGFICLTRFQFASGRKESGYCSPQDSSGMDYVQPTIILGERHWNLWSESCPSNLSPKEVFPLAMKCCVEADEGFFTTTIESAPLEKKA